MNVFQTKSHTTILNPGFNISLSICFQLFPFVFVRLVIQYNANCVFGKLCSFCRHFTSVLQVTGCKVSKNKCEAHSDFHTSTLRKNDS